MNDNKKLAEWAGFKFRAESGFGKCWVDPIEHRHQVCPNFTEDETACFGWLVPKLKGLCKSWMLLPAGKNKFQFQYILPDDLDWTNSGHQETPALALCKAIIKLLEDK